MTGITDLKDLDNDIEDYKRVNFESPLEDDDYEVFGSIISKNNSKLKEFYVNFGLYDFNGFVATIKKLEETSIIIKECYIIWIVIGNPLKLSKSSNNEGFQIYYIEKSIILQPNKSVYNIKTPPLFLGNNILINAYYPSTNCEPNNIKLIEWKNESINVQIMKPTSNNSNFDDNNIGNDDSDDIDNDNDSDDIDNDSLTNIEMNLRICILSTYYNNLKIDNYGEKKFSLDLIGYTLTKENLSEKLQDEMDKFDSIQNIIKYPIDYINYGPCPNCNQFNTDYTWCQSCNSKCFKQNFENWTSGNSEIDKLIQKVQLKAKNHREVLEWIEYNKFENIEYLDQDKFGITYKAIWKDGFIRCWDSEKNQWERWRKYEIVTLKCLNLQNVKAKFLKEIESYLIMNHSSNVIHCYGITKDPKTNTFKAVIEYAKNGNLKKYLKNNYYLLDWIEKLKILQNIVMGLNDIHKNGLVHCDLNSSNILLGDNNFAFIANFRLFELYQSSDQRETEVSPYIAPEIFKRKEYTQASDVYDFGTIIYEIYTGLLPYINMNQENDIPTEHFSHKIPQSILETIKQCWNKDSLYRPKVVELFKLFNKLLNETFQMNLSANGRTEISVIDKYLLKLDTKSKVLKKLCEKCGKKYIKNAKNKWCKSCHLDDLNNNFTYRNSLTVEDYNLIQRSQLDLIPYSEFIEIKEIDGKDGFATALWKNSPLHNNDKKRLVRISYEKVVLKYLHNSQNITEKLTNKVLNESYLLDKINHMYQNYGITKSPNTENYFLVFNNKYFQYYCEKCDNELESLSSNLCKICQINYLKSNFINWTSKNKKLDEFIQKKQLEIFNSYNDVFEWIPYDKFIEIEKIELANDPDEKFGLATALWMDGPLYYDMKELKRTSYEKVVLRYLHYIKDITDEFINKVESYLMDYKYQNYKYQIYGITQNPETRDYILVFNDKYFDFYCEKCDIGKLCKICQINYLISNFINWTSKNKKLDEFIQKKQLEIFNSNNAIFEWIPYNKFIIEIDEKFGLAIALWMDGPLYYNISEKELKRKPHEKVVLRYLHNLKDITSEFINKVELYLMDYKHQGYKYQIYGITQNPETRDYILVFNDKYFNFYCEKYGNNKLVNDFKTNDKWCQQCQSNYLKNNSITWASTNKKNDIQSKFQQSHAQLMQDPEKDLGMAFHWFQKAAEKGYERSMHNLALHYDNGKGIEKDLGMAFYWFQKAAEKGYEESMYGLALCYYNGKGTEKDLKIAFYWFQKAAEKDHKISMHGLALCYYNGEGTKKDLGMAFHWFQKAVEKDHEESMYNLALCYENGEGTEKDLGMAFHWFQKVAEKGHKRSMYSLALCYYNGEGTMKDLGMAFHWFQKAAEKDHEDSMYNLAFCYENGEGTKKDLEMAFYWFQKAAGKGHKRSMYGLALYYYNGERAEKDLGMAFHWFQKAAEKGHKRSMHSLALQYYNGEGTEKDLEMAFHWFQKAAEKDHEGSMYNLALCYENGEGIEKDLEMAFYWFQKAAERGHEKSMHGLALCYYNGEGTEKDLGMAFYWFQKAAEKGHEGSMHNLALCYENGEGTEKNLGKAFYWHKITPDNFKINNLCKKCNQPYIDYKWCQQCNIKQFQQDFSKWTSKNKFIDKFIQEAQLNAKSNYEVLEWIPYNKLNNINYYDKGGFSEIYRAIWLDGPIDSWNFDEQQWNRWTEYEVILKNLNNSSSLSDKFLDEV
ncbi:HCP-like protein [Rhizophagus irregularis]|uniref:HCP-like protein n=1 Tax=Rhizophagus irregularis TaxID=588596 RepID=A0A2I1GXY6_9GLOM|nr:HCP-like protein [Rhizophagus irregularis]